jgi:hypothetical protein
VINETMRDTGEWLLEVALTPAQLAWLQQQDGFRDEYLLVESATNLAATGS